MKEYFCMDRDVAFLNHGSFGAAPLPVLDALRDAELAVERNPVEFLARRSGALLAAVRGRLGCFVGADAEDLALLPNATQAVNVAARSVGLGPGDEVLMSDMEYGACEAAWRQVCAESGARVVRFPVGLPYPGDDAFMAALEASAGPRTKVLFLSAVSSATALFLPARRACAWARASGVASVIDGAHVPGHVPLDLKDTGADWYAGNLHKWLCGPKGTAFLYVRRELHRTVFPWMVSWGAVAEETGSEALSLYTGSSVLERRLQWMGTRDLAPFLALPAALDFRLRFDWEGLSARCRDLARKAGATARSMLGTPAPAEPAALGQMEPVLLPRSAAADPEGLRALLFGRYGVEIPVMTYGDDALLRISVQVYNDESDIERLLDALRDIFG